MQKNNQPGTRLSAREKMAMAAGAAAAITGSTAADASIIYVDNNPLYQSSYDGQGSSTNWDVDGDGGADFQLWVRSSTFFFSAFNWPFSARQSSNFYGIVNFASDGIHGTNLNGRGLVGVPGRANALFNSFQVGPTLAGGYQWNGNGDVRYRSAARLDFSNHSTRNYNASYVTNTNTFTTTYGATYTSQSFYTTFNTTTISGGNGNSGPGIDFQNFVTGPNYLGFRFESAGQLLYGWAEIDIFGGDLQISRWAYEDVAGRGIHVGSISSVPEPATLALLGLGAAGLLAFRNRKEKRDAGQAEA